MRFIKVIQELSLLSDDILQKLRNNSTKNFSVNLKKSLPLVITNNHLI